MPNCERNNHVVVSLDDMTNMCFVVMPFKPLFQTEFERVIRPAVEDAGLTCIRGDEIYAQQSIIQDVWRSLRQARLIIAELSERNPNVMYAGLAHTINKPIVLLTRDENDVPFDLRALRYIYYDTNNPFWGNDLQLELTNIIQRVLASPLIGAHLAGVSVNAPFLPSPTAPIEPSAQLTAKYDLAGVWETSWISIRTQIKHEAILVVPADHGEN